jgi:glycolate oxidase iron-sulfur subunit
MDRTRYLSELSHCVRCGTCKAFCPTYNEERMEAMGARGKIALLWGLSTGALVSSPMLNDRIFSCTLCGACSGLCPAGIDIKELIYHGRTLLKKTDKKRRFLRFFAKLSTNRPRLSFKLLTMTRHVLFPYLSKKGILPSQSDFPGHRLKDNPQVIPASQKKGRVAVFTGCTVNMLYPQLGESLIHVLHRLGYEVILPAGEVCCGAPLRSLGLEEEAIRLAQKNIDIFSKLNVKAVLSLCPTCTLTISNEYKKLIGKGIDNAADISTFLTEKIGQLPFLNIPSHLKKALYHDPCHLKYGLGIEKEPREIIRNIGLDLIETKEDTCCGFAGLFCLSFQDLSRELLKKCVRDYEKSNADMIITSCPGCIIQLKKEVKNKPVMHLIEVLEETVLQES